MRAQNSVGIGDYILAEVLYDILYSVVMKIKGLAVDACTFTQLRDGYLGQVLFRQKLHKGGYYRLFGTDKATVALDSVFGLYVIGADVQFHWYYRAPKAEIFKK